MHSLFHAVTSDQHFNHEAVIRYSRRPFASVEEMNERLIEGHNATVGRSETCLFLGDFAFGTIDQAQEVLARLNGRKVLVVGNHDRSAARMAKLGFDLVVDRLTTTVGGQLVRASHRPYAGMRSAEEAQPLGSGSLSTWPREGREGFLLHGHTHLTKRREGQAVHVGVDAWDYRPARIEEIEQLLWDARDEGA